MNMKKKFGLHNPEANNEFEKRLLVYVIQNINYTLTFYRRAFLEYRNL